MLSPPSPQTRRPYARSTVNDRVRTICRFYAWAQSSGWMKHPYRLTVTTLAREARVGRNAIYANHREMIDALRRADQQRIVPDKLAAWEDKLAQQRSLIQALQIDERRLVTENAVLLKRLLEAQAEATRQKRHADQLIAERDQGLKPIAMVPRPAVDVQRRSETKDTARNGIALKTTGLSVRSIKQDS
jgi:hypothetical protein